MRTQDAEKEAQPPLREHPWNSCISSSLQARVTLEYKALEEQQALPSGTFWARKLQDQASHLKAALAGAALDI